MLTSCVPVFEISGEREGLSIHIQRESLVEPSMRSILCHKDIPISPRFSPTTFYRQANSAFYNAQFLYTPVQIDEPCRLEAQYARNKKCLFCIAQQQHHLLQSMKVFLHVPRDYKVLIRSLRRQDPALEIVHPDREGLSTHTTYYILHTYCIYIIYKRKCFLVAKRVFIAMQIQYYSYEHTFV